MGRFTGMLDRNLHAVGKIRDNPPLARNPYSPLLFTSGKVLAARFRSGGGKSFLRSTRKAANGARPKDTMQQLPPSGAGRRAALTPSCLDQCSSVSASRNVASFAAIGTIIQPIYAHCEC